MCCGPVCPRICGGRLMLLKCWYPKTICAVVVLWLISVERFSFTLICWRLALCLCLPGMFLSDQSLPCVKWTSGLFPIGSHSITQPSLSLIWFQLFPFFHLFHSLLLFFCHFALWLSFKGRHYRQKHNFSILSFMAILLLQYIFFQTKKKNSQNFLKLLYFVYLGPGLKISTIF